MTGIKKVSRILRGTPRVSQTFALMGLFILLHSLGVLIPEAVTGERGSRDVLAGALFLFGELLGLWLCLRTRPEGVARALVEYIFLYIPTFVWVFLVATTLYAFIFFFGTALGSDVLSPEVLKMLFSPYRASVLHLTFSFGTPLVQALWIRRSMSKLHGEAV